MSALAAGIGYLFIVVALATWFSPYLCRVLAAAFMTHADAVEDYRDRRRFHWDRHADALGIGADKQRPTVGRRIEVLDDREMHNLWR